MPLHHPTLRAPALTFQQDIRPLPYQRHESKCFRQYLATGKLYTQPVGAPCPLAPCPLILNDLSLRAPERTATRGDVPGNISRDGKCWETTGPRRYLQPCEKNQEVTGGCIPEKQRNTHRKQEKRKSTKSNTFQEQPGASRLAVCHLEGHPVQHFVLFFFSFNFSGKQ